MIRTKCIRIGRYACTIICLVTMLLSAACSAQQTASTSQPADSEPQPSVAQTQPETVTPQVGNEESMPTGVSHDAYSLEILEQWVDIDTFISAEMLQSRFGDFYQLQFAVEWKETPFSGPKQIEKVYTDCYYYRFVKEYGGKYDDLYVWVEKLQADGEVRHLLKTEDTILSSDGNPEDLREANRQGTYRVGNVEYVYVSDNPYASLPGSLCYIQWKTNGYVFRINLDQSDIMDDTLDDGGFVEQLLREETAEAAIEQFSKELLAYDLEAPVQLRPDGENGN